MKKAFIIYFSDQSAVVSIACSHADALSQLSNEQLDIVSRIDLVPYPVL